MARSGYSEGTSEIIRAAAERTKKSGDGHSRTEAWRNSATLVRAAFGRWADEVPGVEVEDI
jgi:hypothetical protein